MPLDTNSLVIGGYVLSLLFDSISSILISATNLENYNPFAVVFWCLLLKTVICLVIYICQIQWTTSKSALTSLVASVSDNKQLFLLYTMPAFLYLISDSLWYFNLSNFDAFTYSMLWQTRIAVTAVLYQILFRCYLSRTQWFSLSVLLIGCVVKQMDTSVRVIGLAPLSSYALVFLQIFFSCFAGVYNEYLLKDQKLHLMIQNIFMYVNSMVLNVMLIIVVYGIEKIPLFITEVLPEQPNLMFVLLNASFLGLMTSLYLKNLNSVFRTYGAVFQIIFIAILNWIFQGIAINSISLCSIVLVVFALVVYVRHPIKTVKRNVSHRSNDQIELKYDETIGLISNV